jgi:hypothetical protein
MSPTAIVQLTKGLVKGLSGFTVVALALNLLGKKVPILSDITTHSWKQ